MSQNANSVTEEENRDTGSARISEWGAMGRSASGGASGANRDSADTDRVCDRKAVLVEEVDSQEWVSGVCEPQLPPDHPCCQYIREKGLDLGVPRALNRFTGDPSPLGGKRWYVVVSILGTTGEFLVDTGASHSFISKKFYGLLTGNHENLNKRVNACSADGTRMTTFGRTLVAMELGGKEFIFSPTIASISDDGILGLDFASLYGAILTPDKGVLNINEPYNVSIQCVLRQISSVATVVQTLKIPPGQTCDVLVRSQSVLRGQESVVEPDTTYLSSIGLESVDTLVASGSWSLLPVSNRGTNVVYIQKGCKVGTVTASAGILDSMCGSVGMDPEPEVGDTPPELKTMLDATALDCEEDRTRLRRALERHKDAFALKGQPLGRTDRVVHTIDTGDARPFKLPYRRMPFGRKKIVEEQVEQMLLDGVVKPSTSPWSSPVQLVNKKDGTIRFCVDYRKLNGVTKKNAYPLPRIDETLDSLGGNNWFCTLDLQAGYWQIAMAEKDKEKTAFSSHMGLYQFELMPFGLYNAPATFEAMMETLLSDLIWKKCLVYLDDVIVFGKTFNECLNNLTSVLGRITSNGLKLIPKKCALFQKEIWEG